MAENSTASDALHLHEKSLSERQVVVHPSDEDLFVLTGRQVIKSCQLGTSVELWLEEVSRAEAFVAAWCADHSGKVNLAFLVPRPSQLALFFAHSDSQFDFDLADEMTELSSQLVHEFNIGMVDMYQVPKAEISRFVDQARAKLIYEHGND